MLSNAAFLAKIMKPKDLSMARDRVRMYCPPQGHHIAPSHHSSVSMAKRALPSPHHLNVRKSPNQNGQASAAGCGERE
jgi:hypothetical protein